MNFLLTPPFYKIQSLISVALSSGITFLLRAVCFPSPHNADVGENRLHDHDRLKECLCVRQGAGTTVLCQFAFRFSQFYRSKAVFIYIVRSPRFTPSPCFYTQSGVLILYLVRVLNPVRSPWSTVHSPQFMFYTDQFTLHWIPLRADTKSYPVSVR